MSHALVFDVYGSLKVGQIVALLTDYPVEEEKDELTKFKISAVEETAGGIMLSGLLFYNNDAERPGTVRLDLVGERKDFPAPIGEMTILP